MKRIFHLGAACGAIALSGCSIAPHATSDGDSGISPFWWLAGGSLVGAGLAEATNNDDERSHVVGAVIGGAISYFACEDDAEPAAIGDADGDGVNDNLDPCPNTPQGATIDQNGCPQDSDGDSIVDGVDQCAGTPLNAKVNTIGCPLDTDKDGVIDGIDQCPGTPQNTLVDNRGCPEVQERLIRLQGVNFDFDQSNLDDGTIVILNQGAEILRNNARVRVEVQGHTDDIGSDQYNQALSEQRAQAVVDYMINAGIATNRMEPRGYGETQPIVANDSNANRALNRRVDFVVIK